MVKTMAWINAVLASMWALMGVALFAQKMGQQTVGILLSIVCLYAMFVYVPADTAWALFKRGSPKKAKAAVRLNFFTIAMGGVSLAAGVVTGAYASVVIAPLLLMIPQWLSIQALRRVMAMHEAESAAAFPPIVAPDQG